MIEINLLPGAAKRTRRKSKLALPGAVRKLGAMPSIDRGRTGAAVTWIAAPLIIGWLLLGAKADIRQLDIRIEGAQRDSVRFATIIAANQKLIERKAAVGEKLQIIQEIDVARYVWPHLLDEISRAVPPYMWLVSVIEAPGGAGTFKPRFEIQGRTGSPFALTQFMRDLEASAFVRSVTLVNSQQVREDDRMVYAFTLTAQWQDPPADAIQFVPVFADLEVF
jgi:Tfp pilus assembly protein PilN